MPTYSILNIFLTEYMEIGMHGRTAQRQQLKRKLEAGISIHMPAPRRIGKTWTLNRLASDLAADGWCAIEVDVEGIRTPEAFARELCKRIEAQSTLKAKFEAHFSQRIANLLGGGFGDRPLDALGKVDPLEFLETLIASLDEAGTRSAILIDEIAYFFLHCAEDDPKGANSFAYRLRALEQRYKNVRWVLTGSIGLDTIAKQYGIEGAFVDFETFVLEPFTTEEARSFIRDPEIQQQFNHMFDASDADFDSMFTQLGWLAPFYLKLVANEVRPAEPGADGKPPIVSTAEFEAAFERLLQPNRQSEFAVWREHVSKNLPTALRQIAMHLLHRLSETPDGEILDTLLARAEQAQKGATKRQVRDVLAILINDGLITKCGDRYAFRSGLVRRYWHEYEAE